jgi:hypothetical protein
MGFQGMTSHWMEVKEGKRRLQAEVIGFKALSGPHSGENLSRYAVGLLDRAEIMSKMGSKVSTVLIDIDLMLSTDSLLSCILPHWITHQTTTRLPEQLRISTFIVALSGIATRSNYHTFTSFSSP